MVMQVLRPFDMSASFFPFLYSRPCPSDFNESVCDWSLFLFIYFWKFGSVGRPGFNTWNHRMLIPAIKQLREKRFHRLSAKVKISPFHFKAIILLLFFFFRRLEIREEPFVSDTLGMFLIGLHSKLLAANSSSDSPAASVICVNGGIPMVRL